MQLLLLPMLLLLLLQFLPHVEQRVEDNTAATGQK